MNSSYNYIRQASLFTMNGLPDPRMETARQFHTAAQPEHHPFQPQSAMSGVVRAVQAIGNLIGLKSENYQQR